MCPMIKKWRDKTCYVNMQTFPPRTFQIGGKYDVLRVILSDVTRAHFP